ncbi:MAG: OmpA family protein [Saprospiraceae bacterium]
MNRIFVKIFFCIVVTVTAFPELLACEKANEAYDRLLFSVAIQEYEKCIKSGLDIVELERLAKAYRNLGNSGKALNTINRIETKDKMSLSSKIEYAYLLWALDSRENALNWVDNCLAIHSGHPQLLNMKDVFTKDIHFEENKVYQVDKAPFNSEQSDYSPSLYDQKIVFSSTRIKTKEIDGYTAENYSRLYFYDYLRQKVSPFATEITGQNNIGSTTFNTLGNEMFFTKNRDKVNSRNMATFMIWNSVAKDGTWSVPTPAFLQNEEYNYVHPTVSPNGKKIIFSSDHGGSNSLDLYICERPSIKGKWSEPQKLPDYINSVNDEVFPSFLSDSVIVFSHESPEGLGGLDMFTIKFTNALWSAPVNLGKPFNSPFDDYGMVSDDLFSRGYFTSTRENGQGIDNIYSFVKKPVEFVNVTLEIKDSITGLPIQDVAIVYVEDNLQAIVYTTDSLGRISLTVNSNKEAGLIIAYKGTLLKTIKLPLLDGVQDDEAKITIVYNNRDFILSGTTVNNQGKIVPEVEMAFIEEKSNDSQRVKSDETGNFEVTAKENSNYRVTAQKEGYYTPIQTINTQSYSRDSTWKVDVEIPIEKAVLEKVFQLKHIYYDFDQWNIRSDGELELDNLIFFLQKNPEVRIELGSHTDVRGKAAYNLRLSQRRAESVLAYLHKNNIDLSRVKAKGYGESELVNGCTENVECSEAEHQANRRTEIKIIKL